MKRSDSKRRYFVVTAAVMSLMVFAVPILAQQDDITIGRIAGSQAARANTNGTAWFFAGCTLIGLVLSYVLEPNPPATMLLGKSPEYVAAYTDAYRTTAKSVQSGKAWTGCIVAGGLYLAYIVLLVAAAESI